VGPVLGLIEGTVVVGDARGGTLGIPMPTGKQLFVPGRKYSIFAGGVVAYGEVDLGIVRPFLGFLWGSADGDPTDKKLHGFAPYGPLTVSSQFTGVPIFAHFDNSPGIGLRDRACPARLQGLPNRATSSLSIGTAALAAGGNVAGANCWHEVVDPFNTGAGELSHLGIWTTYSNVGTVLIPVGVKVFPLRGHELTGWYGYRAMVDSKLLEIAFAPELAAQGKRHISKGIYHEVGAYWLWTLNPNFDIRLAGNLAFAAEGSKDLAELSDCNLNAPGVQRCQGKDVALHAEARFRARF
jgi:hypothetical protein